MEIAPQPRHQPTIKHAAPQEVSAELSDLPRLCHEGRIRLYLGQLGGEVVVHKLFHQVDQPLRLEEHALAHSRRSGQVVVQHLARRSEEHHRAPQHLRVVLHHIGHAVATLQQIEAHALAEHGVRHNVVAAEELRVVTLQRQRLAFARPWERQSSTEASAGHQLMMYCHGGETADGEFQDHYGLSRPADCEGVLIPAIAGRTGLELLGRLKPVCELIRAACIHYDFVLFVTHFQAEWAPVAGSLWQSDGVARLSQVERHTRRAELAIGR